jgi:hypothetical protein
MNRYDLFPTPIFVKKAASHDVVKKHINDNIKPVYEKQGYNSPVCNVFSDYFDGAPRLDQDQFTEFYRSDFEELFMSYGFNPNVSWFIRPYFWYNITGKGGWQEEHNHISGPMPIMFSAIHYVEFDKSEHKAVEFYNPHEQILRSTSPSENKENLPPFFKELATTPSFIEEGDLIFFPSYLRHAVIPQQSEKLRISIAMNIGIYDRESIYVNKN